MAEFCRSSLAGLGERSLVSRLGKRDAAIGGGRVRPARATARRQARRSGNGLIATLTTAEAIRCHRGLLCAVFELPYPEHHVR